MEPETKPWWASKGVWGGVVAAAAGLAGLWGVTVGPAEVEQIVTLFTAVTSAVAGLVAVWGRIRASRRLS